MFQFLNYLLNEQTEEKNKHASLHFHLCDNRLRLCGRMEKNGRAVSNV